MWKRPVAAVLAATLALVAIAATPAQAQLPPPPLPFYGDLNGDGLTDLVTLGENGPEECWVTVHLGRAGGGYLPGRSAGYGIDPGYCPSRGTIIDIGGDGRNEIVLSWTYDFSGYHLLVMRDFEIVDSYSPPLDAPDEIATRDVNSDGFDDLYMESASGFATLQNTRGGRLLRSPLELLDCHQRPDWLFADFRGDGVLGALIFSAYQTSCVGLIDAGVLVTELDGSRTELESGVHPNDGWWADALDANSDGRQDVVTEHNITGEITHFIRLRNGTFGESPRAVFDRPTVNPNRPAVINVLANDYATKQATVTITSQPKFGTVTVNPDRTITYTRLRPHDGGDRFTYLLTQDGKKHRTPVTIRFAG